MKKKVKVKPIFPILILLFAVIFIGSGVLWRYLQNPVDSNDKSVVEVEIKSGTSSSQIGKILKEKNLIKSEVLFKIYLRVNNVNSLKASTYKFNKSMSLEDIVKSLEKGVISNDGAIKMTFKDGERITDYALVISESLGIGYEDVIAIFKDREYANTLINEYWFLTDKILDSNIYYPLEGYLAPNTYFFDKDADVKDVIKRLLSKMEEDLEKYKKNIINDPHYYLTMASMVQIEGTNDENRKMIVGVFENRLKSGYNLGCDATTYYALQLSMKNDLSSEQLNTVNPYNTRGANMIGKMPIGPICNPNLSSIEASVNPVENDYLFFVADKNGKIYFTKTFSEHDAKIREIKAAGNWIFD